MQTLKFLGRGSAFNKDERNTSAYYKKDNSLLLIDCGEDIFKKILKINLLEDVSNVNVLITHLHSDHVGSLPSLILYCYYVKHIKVNVYFQLEIMKVYLKSSGITDKMYTFNSNDSETIANMSIVFERYKQTHCDEIKSFAYTILIDNNIKLFYSGDCNDILCKYCIDEYDEIYHDTCIADYKGNVHCNIHKLVNTIYDSRDKVYCMHLDNSKELIDNIKQLGFNVVEVVKYGDINER